MISIPDRSEAAEYYFRYIDLVPPGDICDTLRTQLYDTLVLLRGVSASRSLTRYEAGKWSLRDMVNHLSDTERLFGFRAFWIARGFDAPLPSFDQDLAAGVASADTRSWPSLIDEFQAVRVSTLSFFQSLSAEAWMRRGVASGHSITVRALAFLAVGHVAHHSNVMRTRYLSD